MNSYIVKISSLISAFEIQAFEKPIQYRYTTQSTSEVFSKIETGDRIFICYDTEDLGIKMLLKVVSVFDANTINITKVMEIEKPINITTQQQRTALLTNDILLIDDTESTTLLSKMIESVAPENIGEEAHSALAPISFYTGYGCSYSRNRILFGAPGTGKSFTLKNEAKSLLAHGGHNERVTFHPDYSYANFVGTYKPVPSIDSDGKDAITYSYVPGPFMRVYVKALKNSRELNPLPHLLVIEEINRANVAAVFGDVFQLLDRGDDEVSEYPIQASEDIKKYLASELGGDPEDYAEIRLPDNMFIWATMNSADQGVFPMDTAFKRRWDFTYLGIDDSEAGIIGKTVILGKGEYRRVVEWNALRKAINEELLTYKVNEDKLMGPYFISKKNLPEGNVIDPVEFTRIFKNKVIMYLFDDAAKQKRITLFGGCDEKAKNQYSKICAEFDTKGVFIFCEDVRKKFIEIPEGAEE